MKHIKRVSVPQKAQFFPEEFPPLVWWIWIISFFGVLKAV